MARKINIRTPNMPKSIAVIGEGMTEQYYLQSLKGIINAQIEPKLPKHPTGLQYVETEIKNCIDKGYAQIICLIDMDNKKGGRDKQQYDKLKSKYHNRTISRPKEGIKSTVTFFENEPCIELWFLYYFKYTTAYYEKSDKVTKELKSLCSYEKTEQFFISSKGIHLFLINHGGDFEKAKVHAKKSTQSRKAERRDHTYSEMNDFFSLISR